MRKIFTLFLFALVATGASAQKITILKNGYLGLAVSENGKYVCGDSELGSAFIWDVENNTVVTDADKYPEASACSISDEGLAVGYIGDEAVSFDLQGSMTKLNDESYTGFSTSKWITPDGKTIVGSDFDESYSTHACVWKNGVKTLLPEPTTDELGFETNGTQAIAASSDGKTIVGFVVDNMGTYPLIYWTEDADGSYKLHTPCKDLFEPEWGDKPYLMMQPTGISSNGEWIALMAQKNSMEYLPIQMARMNVKTGNIETGEVEESESLTAETEFETAAIANDGTMVGQTASRMGMMGRLGILWKGGEKNPKLIADVYPSLAELAAYNLTTTIVSGISSDCRYITGFGVSEDYQFETFFIDTTAEPTAIDTPAVADTQMGTAIYGIDGKAVNVSDKKSLGKGLYIIKSGTGKDVRTRKLIIK